MIEVSLKTRLAAWGFPDGYVRLVRVRNSNKNSDKAEVEAHITLYPRISKQDGLPTVRLVVQDFTGSGSKSLAVSYDLIRVESWLKRALKFVEAITMARALAKIGVIDFYCGDQERKSGEVNSASKHTSRTSTSEATSGGINPQALTALLTNPELASKLLGALGLGALSGKSDERGSNDKDEGGVIEV